MTAHCVVPLFPLISMVLHQRLSYRCDECWSWGQSNLLFERSKVLFFHARKKERKKERERERVCVCVRVCVLPEDKKTYRYQSHEGNFIWMWIDGAGMSVGSLSIFACAWDKKASMHSWHLKLLATAKLISYNASKTAPVGLFVWPSLVIDAGVCEHSHSDIDEDW